MVPYAKRMEKMAFTANVVKGLFGSMTNPDIISFSGGSPAREALPVDTIRQLADEVLRTDTRGVEALQYGPIEGIRDLREVVVRELLAPKGIDCGVDNVIIITGGLEGINLACQAYIDPGEVILVEAPTFVQSVEIFDMFEARCVGVAMDDNGLIPEDLERKIRQCHPKMIYVIPTFQNPSGRTLSLERRKAVAMETKDMFDNAFRFLETTFGDSQELVIFVTEITAGYDTSWFVEQFGCDAYFRHNRELLFDSTRHRIREEIAAAKAAEQEENT